MRSAKLVDRACRRSRVPRPLDLWSVDDCHQGAFDELEAGADPRPLRTAGRRWMPTAAGSRRGQVPPERRAPQDRTAATIWSRPYGQSARRVALLMNLPSRLARVRGAADAAPIRDFLYGLGKLRKCQHMYLAETTDRGLGVFAAREFSVGEIVMMDFDGDYYDQVLSYAELRERNISLKYPLQVGRDLFRLPSGTIDDFMNHSCDSNAGIRLYPHGSIILAIRHINVHEEITFDYSTYLNNPYEQLRCHCGAKNCRGLIGNFNELPKDLQQRYLALRVVGEFALQDHAADDALA
jgi:uncharacterized protein